MADVFMSYSREDRARAEKLANALGEQGWSVWWDRKIAAGTSFDTIIEQQLDSARCALVLWSKTSINSEWVKNEAAAALEREALIPILIDEVRQPIEFRRRQAIDLVGWNGDAASPALQPLLEGIAERLGGKSDVRIETPPTARQRGPSRTSLAMVVAVVAIAGGTFWMTSKRGDADSSAVEPSSAGAANATNAVTYAMKCRGGGPFEVRNESTGGVRIGFVPSDQPASESMIPGQCSWTDRTINEQEPREICDATEGRSQLVDALARPETITVRVYYEPATKCFRVVRY
ncbi:MAG TPA: toll/interleukin-1 receptor domain-containing protein [Steroidobacteraceae bacterium]|nr:toll/interleukin-1 receptor domain-containing protein [Steroidobacteraceae bacterium]